MKPFTIKVYLVVCIPGTFSIKTKQSDGTVAPVPPATATPLPPRAD
jgi:hypothetical protein